MMIKKTPTTLKEKEGCKHSLYERVCFKEHCVSVRLICRGGWWLYHALALTPSRRLQFLFSSLWNANIMCISSLSFYELNYVLEKRIYIMKKKNLCLGIFIFASEMFQFLYIFHDISLVYIIVVMIFSLSDLFLLNLIFVGTDITDVILIMIH